MPWVPVYMDIHFNLASVKKESEEKMKFHKILSRFARGLEFNKILSR